MRPSGFHRLRACRRGATALEFAIAGPVMLLLMFAIIEDGLMLFAQSVLDNATRDVSRQIMIGNITTAAAFQAKLCSEVTTFFDCTKLQFNVQASSVGFPLNVVATSLTNTLATATYNSGDGSDFVTVEVVYTRSYMIPWLQRIAGPSWTLMTTQAFQNEPFS